MTFLLINQHLILYDEKSFLVLLLSFLYSIGLQVLSFKKNPAYSPSLLSRNHRLHNHHLDQLTGYLSEKPVSVKLYASNF